MSQWRYILWVSWLSSVGCVSDEKVNIGDDDKPSALGAALSDYAGDWQGYAEAYQFTDGTDSVRLTLNARGEGSWYFGRSALLAPPDATRGWPGFDQPRDTGDLVVTGFNYPVHDPRIEERRARLDAHSSDLYAEWCTLQTPHPVKALVGGLPIDMPEYKLTDPLVYNCIGWSANAIDYNRSNPRECVVLNEPDKFDCSRTTCISTCSCDEHSCKLAEDLNDVHLDAALQADGAELVGTLQFVSGAGTRVNVRLTRTSKH
jgi:hypothetical protein